MDTHRRRNILLTGLFAGKLFKEASLWIVSKNQPRATAERGDDEPEASRGFAHDNGGRLLTQLLSLEVSLKSIKK